jgi:hypothetical protein
VLAGCSRDLGPKNYNDEVRNNYMENCVKGSTDKLGATGAATYCECTYSAISKGIHFDKFKEFETYLRDHVGDDINTVNDLDVTNKFDDILGFLNGCVVAGPTASG